MNEEFNWLEYSESVDRAAAEAEESSSRKGLGRLLPRRPKLPGLPRLPRWQRLPLISRPRLPGLPSLPRLPRLRRGAPAAESNQPSASDLLGGQTNRPVEELDDRLRALRERSGGSAPPPAAPNQTLLDVDEVLVSPAFQQKPGGVISAMALSKAQQQQVEMLKDIVGGPLQSHEGEGRRLPASGVVLFLERGAARAGHGAAGVDGVTALRLVGLRRGRIAARRIRRRSPRSHHLLQHAGQYHARRLCVGRV